MKITVKKLASGMLAAALIFALALSMSACGKSDTSSTDTSTANTSSVDTSSALKRVYECLIKEDSEYSEFKGYYAESLPDVKFEEKLEDTKITISASGSEYAEGTWDFVLDGDYLTINVNQDDFMGAMMVSNVASAIGDYLGMDRDLLTGYLNGMGILDYENTDYIIKQDEATGTYTFKLNITKPYEMKELDQMVIDKALLSDYEPLSEESSSIMFTIGKVSMSVNGSADELTVLLREYGQLDEVALKSVVNAISYFKPKGYENFVADFTKIEEVETDGYKVSLRVDDETLEDSVFQKDEKYSFMMVTFGGE